MWTNLHLLKLWKLQLFLFINSNSPPLLIVYLHRHIGGNCATIDTTHPGISIKDSICGPWYSVATYAQGLTVRPDLLEQDAAHCGRSPWTRQLGYEAFDVPQRPSPRRWPRPQWWPSPPFSFSKASSFSK